MGKTTTNLALKMDNKQPRRTAYHNIDVQKFEQHGVVIHSVCSEHGLNYVKIDLKLKILSKKTIIESLYEIPLPFLRELNFQMPHD